MEYTVNEIGSVIDGGIYEGEQWVEPIRTPSSAWMALT